MHPAPLFLINTLTGVTKESSEKFGGRGGNRTNKTPRRSMNLSVQIDPGPWGAQRGRQWDDGVFVAVKRVILRTGCAVPEGNTIILGIQFEYEQRDGKSFTSPWHGNFPGGQWRQMELDFGDEIIVGIEGFYGPAKGTDECEIITSLSIYTNMRKHGPFGGKEIGTHFSSTLSGGKVVGFFGRSGAYLNAIGVHMEYDVNPLDLELLLSTV